MSLGIIHYNQLCLYEATNTGLDTGQYKQAKEIDPADFDELPHSEKYDIIYPFLIR